MMFKRFKSNAAAELLHEETNIYFINPATNKMDFKTFSKNLLEKDECANMKLDDNLFEDKIF